MRIESVTYYSQASCCTRSNSLPTVFRLVEGEATAVYTCMNVLTTAVYNHCITLGVITQVTHFSYSIGRVSLMPASQQTRCSWMWLKLWDNIFQVFPALPEDLFTVSFSTVREGDNDRSRNFRVVWVEIPLLPLKTPMLHTTAYCCHPSGDGIRAYFHYRCALRCVASDSHKRYWALWSASIALWSYRWLSLATQRHATQRVAVMEIGDNSGGNFSNAISQISTISILLTQLHGAAQNRDIRQSTGVESRVLPPTVT